MDIIKTLFDLYLEYEHQYFQLVSAISAVQLQKEFGYGGESIHRGYYCPSPIFDIVVGNVTRGHLLRQPSATFSNDYIYYNDSDGRLRVTEKYECFSEPTKELYSKEFLIYFENLVIAPTYFVLERFGNRELTNLSVCKYQSDGKILSYAYLARLKTRPRGVALDDFEFRCEDYQYDDNRLLLNACVTEKSPGYYREEKYNFTHAQDGKLMTFQSISRVNNCIERAGKVHQIPKSKQRIV